MTPSDIPNRDIRLKDEFIREHEQVVIWLTSALFEAIDEGKAVDLDAREALAALIQTYRTRESGLIYESRPANPYAAAIQEKLQKAIEELRKHIVEEAGMQTLRDTDILGTLVFLQRLEIQHNNGRRRGRAFADFLRGSFGTATAPISPVSLVHP